MSPLVHSLRALQNNDAGFVLKHSRYRLRRQSCKLGHLSDGIGLLVLHLSPLKPSGLRPTGPGAPLNHDKDVPFVVFAESKTLGDWF